MARSRRKKGPLEAAGPRSWRNWRGQRTGARAATAVELPLYSDARFTAEALNLGPYALLNALPGSTHGSHFEWKPAVVLRAEHLLPLETGDMSVTDDEHCHGVSMYDEVAALVALHLGVRLVAGPIERQFRYNEDPLGRPGGHSAAVLPTLPGRADAPQIPSLFGNRSLADLRLLRTYVDLALDAASALVKSARLHQQAVWVADTSPETAWLLLVSAIETAASFWSDARLTPAQQLELSYASLTKRLRAGAYATVFDDVAATLHGLIGSTGKFVAFCIAFAPNLPRERPRFGTFDFSPAAYKAAIKRIYGYRSRALNGGTPFPTQCAYRRYRATTAPTWRRSGCPRSAPDRAARPGRRRTCRCTSTCSRTSPAAC